jgi:hypothetical protein
MAAKHWMKAAFANSHGQLHKQLGVKAGDKIPRSKLEGAVKKGGLAAKRAQLVMNAHPLR